MATVVAPQKARREQATADRLMKNAKELVPVLKERAQETSKNRTVPKETIEDFWKADLFDVIKPKNSAARTSATTTTSTSALSWRAATARRPGSTPSSWCTS